jgi:very-short-patch-repair endonuclease
MTSCGPPRRRTVNLVVRMEKHFPRYTKVLIGNARRLRREMTEPERKLWSLVRAKQLGVKVRRQVPIGRYIVDFLCEERRLIIELDGSQHYEPEGRRRDKTRDDYLHTQGYSVLRIDNLDLLQYPDSILEEIITNLDRGRIANAPKNDLD